MRADVEGDSTGVGGGAARPGDAGIGVTDVDGMEMTEEMGRWSAKRDERDLIGGFEPGLCDDEGLCRCIWAES